MIHLSETIIGKIHADALQSFPNECCGFLFGIEQEENRTITSILQVTNISSEDQRRRFSISASDYLQAEKLAEEDDLSLLGIYHSHPNHPAVPSETDRLAAQPYFSYLIISVIDGEVSHVRSWQLNENNQFEEEQINQFISTKIKIKN